MSAFRAVVLAAALIVVGATPSYAESTDPQTTVTDPVVTAEVPAPAPPADPTPAAEIQDPTPAAPAEVSAEPVVREGTLVLYDKGGILGASR